MYKEQFYTIQRTESAGNQHDITIKLNENHHIYKGHFPQHPVVPGVCTLQIIKECVSAIAKMKVRYQTISSCKFTSLIVPSPSPITLKITLNETLGCQTTVILNDQSVLKLKANFVKI